MPLLQVVSRNLIGVSDKKSSWYISRLPNFACLCEYRPHQSSQLWRSQCPLMLTLEVNASGVSFGIALRAYYTSGKSPVENLNPLTMASVFERKLCGVQ